MNLLNSNELVLFNNFSKNLKSKRGYIYTLSELKDVADKDLIDIESNDIKDYLNYLRNKNQANTTIQRKYHQLFSFYNYLYDELIIEENPLRKVPTPKASYQLKIERTLTFDDLELLLDTLKEYFPLREYVLTLLIATTGIRLGEALNLKWSDIFIDDSGLIGAVVGNKGNERYVRIFDFIWDEIDKYRTEYLKVGENYLNEDYHIFISESNLKKYKEYPSLVKPITGDWIRKTYVKACEIAGIPLVTAKDIRHTYTMLTMKMGIKGEEIKEQVGWSSLRFLNRYHGIVEQLNTPINKYVKEYYKSIIK